MTALLDGNTFRRLSRARDYAAAHATAAPTLQRLAEEACLSPWHFHRLFVSAFGETPHAFLARLRLDRAKQLLASGTVSVTEACFAAGYTSLGSFSARFSRDVGLSPTAWQQALRRSFGIAAPWRTAFIPTCFLGRFHGAAAEPIRKNREAAIATPAYGPAIALASRTSP